MLLFRAVFCCRKSEVDWVQLLASGHYVVVFAGWVLLSGFHWFYRKTSALVSLAQEKSNREIDLTYKLKVLQQELEQEEASHKATKAMLADKSKIKETIEGAKSESMKGKEHEPFLSGCSLSDILVYFSCLFLLVCTIAHTMLWRSHWFEIWTLWNSFEPVDISDFTFSTYESHTMCIYYYSVTRFTMD